MSVLRQHLQDNNIRIPTDRLLADILRRRFARKPGPIIVAIGGPGGTGKSTFAERLGCQLKAAILPLDDYKTSRASRRESHLFGPHPAANKMDLITTHLSCLRRGRAFTKPVYEAANGDARATEKFTPLTWNLIEGEVATYDQFRNLVDFTIFIDADWRTQLATRLNRDMQQRSYSLDKAIATFLHSNLREFNAHGAASKQWADVHLFCHDNYRLSLESISRTLYDEVRDILHRKIIPVNPEGLIVPLLTPFDRHGTVAPQALLKHLEWLTAAGVSRILVGDDTGEYLSLTATERIKTLQLTLEYFPGLVWFQAGGGPLPEAQWLAREAERLGADGIVCLAPGCTQASPDGIVKYFQQIKNPLRIHFLPANHHQSIKPEMLRELDYYGLVDYDGNRELACAATRYFTGGNILYVHEDDTGWISASANTGPEQFLERPSQPAGYQTNGTKPSVPALKAILRARLPGYPATVRPPLSPA